MRIRSASLGALLVAAVLSPFASGWWAAGHTCIVRAAVSSLPADMPGFFRQGADHIAFYSMEPDLWAGRDVPALRSSERPNHYLDLELLEGRELPPTRQEFHALCRELKLEPETVGTLPYAIREWYDRLVLAFAEYRRFPEEEAIRSKILYVAGVLSHYTADASQPLHCTVHYDGRLKPDGSSPRSGVHLQMDALPGQLGLRPEEIAPKTEVMTVENAFQAALASIRQSHRRVRLVYQVAERLPPADEPLEGEADRDVRALAVECCAAGAELTATLWCSAWIDSADVDPPAWYGELVEQQRR